MTGSAEIVDTVAPGGLGGTFGGNPVVVRGGHRRARRGLVAGVPRARTGARRAAERRLDGIADRVSTVGEVRGLGPMLALELVRDREPKEPAPELASGAVAAARERGLVLLACGLYGNVVRVLVPLVIGDEDLERGLEILEESLVAAGSGDA